jgi:ribonuclease-3
MSRLQQLHNKTTVTEDADLPFNPRNVLLTEDDLSAFFAAHGMTGLPFRNVNLYRTAFVHRSYVTMKNANFVTGNDRCPAGCLPLQDMAYERLEFLGDSVLGMIVARYLYDRYPDQSEGFLSRMRTKIVNGKMLGHLAECIGFSKYAIISRQVEETSGRSNFKLGEDIFEAFIGAILTDFQTADDDIAWPEGIARATGGTFVPLSGAGYHLAEAWVVAVMEKYLDFADLIQANSNYKDMLVRHMSCNFQDAPRFFEVSVCMRSGVKVFTYCVKDKSGAALGTATGASRKDAENLAAEEALRYYGVAR